MNRMCKALVAAAIVTSAAMGPATSIAGGVVSVEFVEPASFTDIGWGSVEREANLRTLAEHLRGWHKRLPDGQRLEIRVLDVDLAGDTNRLPRHPELRVMTGRVDWPRMRLAWTLADGARVLGSGEERVADVAYLDRAPWLRNAGALAYEKRMLDEWLQRRVLDAGAAH